MCLNTITCLPGSFSRTAGGRINFHESGTKYKNLVAGLGIQKIGNHCSICSVPEVLFHYDSPQRERNGESTDK